LIQIEIQIKQFREVGKWKNSLEFCLKIKRQNDFFDRIIKILKNYSAIVLKRLDFENQNFYTLVKEPLMK